MEIAKLSLATLLMLTMAGCAVGPDYTAPSVDVGQAYENQEGWALTGGGFSTILC